MKGNTVQKEVVDIKKNRFLYDEVLALQKELRKSIDYEINYSGKSHQSYKSKVRNSQINRGKLAP